MRVELEDPEQPPESGEVAVDDPFEVRHPASAPVLQLLASQEAHPDEHIEAQQAQATKPSRRPRPSN